LDFNGIDGSLGGVNLFLDFFDDGLDGFKSGGSLVRVSEIEGKIDLGLDS
jgi:hypothetical protein